MNRVSHFLSIHLLPAVTFFFALGISCSQQSSFLSGDWILVLPLITGGYALFSHLRRPPGAALFLIPPFVVSLGLVHGTLAGREPPSTNHIFHLIQKEQEAILFCTLKKMPTFNGENSSLLVAVHSLRLQEKTNFIHTLGLVQLKIKAPWPQKLLPGDQLVIRAKLDRPHTFHNPGSFDYPTFLARQDIRITGWIRSPLHIYRPDQHPAFLHRIRYLPERLRVEIASGIEQTLPPEIGAVYKALLIGDTSGISQKVMEAFKGSGCRHILSISGAHLSILAAFLFFIFYWLLRRSEYLILHYPVKKIAAGLCLLPLAIYTLLAGANTPVIRALIMVAVFMTALCIDRQKDLFTPLALAALLILIWDPNSLFTASFQLSFTAVASIAAVSPFIARLMPQEERTTRFSRKMTKRLLYLTMAALTVSMAATIGTAPLLLYYFNRISVVGPVANLLVEPLICMWSLPLGFLACPLILISPHLADLLLHLGSAGLLFALKLTTFFSNLTFSSLWMPTPSPILIALYYAAILVTLTSIGTDRKVRLLVAAAWSLILFLFCMPPAELLKGQITNSEITFLDVGQGSSTFLQLPTGKRLLVDAGGGATSPAFNTGEDIIAPFLWQRGINHLDTIIITHGDSDHFNGVPFLLQRFRPEILWINDRHGHDNAWDQMLAVAAQLHIKVRIPQPGEELIGGGQAGIVHLGNPSATTGDTSNDRSLILRFSHDNLSCLIAGDISSRVESQLVENNLPLRSTLLLSPHHGSSTSNSENFLKAVDPTIIVVSAGRFHPDHFPNPGVRQRCTDMGIKMMITAEQGAITFTSEEEID